MHASLQLLRENLLGSGILSGHLVFILSFLSGVVLVSLITFFFSQIPHLRTMPVSRQIFFYVLFVISSFMVVKALFSGGALSVEAIAGFIFLMLLALRESYRAQITSVSGVVVYFVFLAVLFILGYFQSETQYISSVMITFGTIIFLSTLYAFYAFGTVRLSYLILILACIPFLLQVYNRLSSYAYLNQRIDQAGAFITSYNPLYGNGYVEIGNVGRIGLYAFVPTLATSTVTVNDVLPMTRLSLSEIPITLPWNTCIPTGAPESSTFKVSSFVPLRDLVKHTSFYRMDADRLNATEGYHYEVSLMVPPCLVDHTSIIASEIMSEQLPSFTVYDLREEN
jgi:hypothetical protein